MKLDLNFYLKGLDGTELKGLNAQVNAGMLLANQIASTNKSTDILKWFTWAQELYKQKPIEVSDNEKNEIKEFVKNSEQLTILAKQQIIEAIEGKVKPLKAEKAA
jgi:hypothetical protein